jgi:hypothetical protein
VIQSNRTVTATVMGFVVALAANDSSPALAGVVEPGETVVVNGTDFVSLEGPVLATSTLSFSITYQPNGPGEFVDFGGTVEGTLTNMVVRDTDRGTLLFVYDIDLDSAAGGDADASDASTLTVNGFGAFHTHVDGALDFESVILASRELDGSAIKLTSDDPGLGGAPRLIVRTDATAFDATGTASFFAGDELAVRTPDGLEIELAAGTAVIGGTFRPVDAGPAPAPNPIPLPPALWSAVVALGAAGVSKSLRRAKSHK